MSVIVGLDAKLYRNTGTFGVPTWDEIPEVQDLNVPLDKGEAEVKQRGLDWRLFVETLKETTIDFELLHDDTAASSDFDVIRDAYHTIGTVIDFLVLDGSSATSGSTGFRAECFVKQFAENQPLEEALTHTVSLRPTPTANAQPTQFTVP